MIPETSRLVALDRIGAHGFRIAVQAAQDELAALAERYRIPAVLAFSCDMHLRRIGDSVIEGQGTLTARVRQICVVSLDEFTQKVVETFTVHFVPDGTEDEEPDPEAVDQIPYAGNAIDAGECVAEQLALALDPYPRKPGALPPGRTDDSAPHPFAALAAMRSKQ